MAKVTLMPGIQSISGRVGDMVFRTNKATGTVYVCMIPRKRKPAK